jgi:SRSO17 transposase
MSWLEHPTAQALLADAEVSAAGVMGCHQRLQSFLQRYWPRFYRIEQHELALVVLQGKLGHLQRKTSEPIAAQAGRHRKPAQHFVGAGGWDDEGVMAELRRHVAAECADPDAVLVLDPSAFPKSGADSCGVRRQWCGRLGKVENCQVGVFLAYVTAAGYARLDRPLYLPREWAADPQRREATHVPEGVTFQERWRIGLDLLDRSGRDVPFGWVAGDDEFGRASAFRAGLRCRRLRYVLGVPANTLIRDPGEAPAPGRRVPPWRRVDGWAKALPAARWRRPDRGAGARGPRVVRAVEAWVQAKDEDGRLGPRERLVVIRSVATEPRVWPAPSNARAEVPLARAVEAQGRRHGVGEVLQAGKGEVGLGRYEVRSRVGWRHHMTLSLLALWFVILGQRRLGKNAGADGAADAGSVCPAAAAGATRRPEDRRRSQPCAPEDRRGADLSPVQSHG